VHSATAVAFVQMLLPPKYEDVIAMPSSAAATAGPQPPAYSED